MNPETVLCSCTVTALGYLSNSVAFVNEIQDVS